jgi:hypothetical protein
VSGRGFNIRAQSTLAHQGGLDHEALELLSQDLRQGQAAAERMQLGKIAARVGEWPQLLQLVNGFLRDRVAKGQPFAQAITGVNKRLNDKGLVAFDGREFSAYPVDVAAWLSAMRPLDRVRAVSRVAESFRWLEQVVPPILMTTLTLPRNDGHL